MEKHLSQNQHLGKLQCQPLLMASAWVWFLSRKWKGKAESDPSSAEEGL